MRRHGYTPSSSEESLMSQNWSDLTAGNYSCFRKTLLECVCLFGNESCLRKGFEPLLSAVQPDDKTHHSHLTN